MTSIYVGTYTKGMAKDEKGIFLLDFDEVTGRLELRSAEESGPNPSFLVLSRDGSSVYTVNELDDGTVSSLKRDGTTGQLTYLSSQSAHGAAPCYIELDPSGKFVLVANYNGGTIAVFPIGADGQMLPASDVVDHAKSVLKPRRDTPPHAHMIAPTPDGNFIMTTDLGLDATLIYRLEGGKFSFDAAGTALAKVGAGPRHFAFSPDGATAYVINELDSTLDVFAYSAGTLSRKQTVSTLPADFDGQNSCAHVVVSSDGRFVYGSNRGHDSIATWAVNAANGEVGLASFTPSGGRIPRNFAIDPTGRWLITAHQDSNNLFVFERDGEAGALTNTGQEVAIPAPVCIVFVPQTDGPKRRDQ